MSGVVESSADARSKTIGSNFRSEGSFGLILMVAIMGL